MDFELDTYTVQEVHAMNGYSYPFWVRPWKTVHSIARITHQTRWRDKAGKEHFRFVGERWRPDGSRCIDDRLSIEVDGMRGWLPWGIDSQSQ